MSAVGGQHGGDRPALPTGRYVWLPGRGHTFVRELAGPAGAPVIMLLHGWTATADLNWFACFEPLAEHFRVIAMDHRGHGRGLHTATPFRLEHCADDVAALAHELGITRLIPVGYSMGGPIGQLLWRQHPELVDGLVLCATSARFTGTVRERVLFGVAAGTSAVAGTVPLSRMTTAAVVAWNGWRSRRGSAWWGFDEVARHDWNQIVEAGRQIGRFDSRSWVGAMTVPTAIIMTEDDDVVPVHRQHELACLVPDATIRRVAGGHAVCTLAPERFVPQLVAACLTVARHETVYRTVAAGSRPSVAA